MVDYPVKFAANAESEKSEEEWKLETEEGLETGMTVPEKFGGDSEKPSPESLFNASLGSCLLATFKVTAERKGLEYGKICLKSETDLDRGEDSRPVMKKAEIQIEVEGVEDRELAEEVAKISEKNCFIHNSVKTDVETEFRFTE